MQKNGHSSLSYPKAVEGKELSLSIYDPDNVRIVNVKKVGKDEFATIFE